MHGKNSSGKGDVKLADAKASTTPVAQTSTNTFADKVPKQTIAK